MSIYKNDDRIVLTLDAGGTNFVFSAYQGQSQIIEPVTLPSFGNDLQKCLNQINSGFEEVLSLSPGKPVAISFAFPGPSDFPNGIIGDLENLTGFKGGVALGPMLEEKFKMPVFINNDGDLFAYGEALAGVLPEINSLLEESGKAKRYHHLLGVTLGTGFGAGIVSHNNLIRGDNAGAGEIYVLRHPLYRHSYVEEGVSIRAIKRVYFREAGIEPYDEITPKDIYDIAKGNKEGNKIAALAAFHEMAVCIADALANAITLVDGIIVIGGGLAGSADILLKDIVDEMNGAIYSLDHRKLPRIVQKVFNFEDAGQRLEFLEGQEKMIDVPFSSKKVNYDYGKRTCVAISKLGASQAISIGAYAFALHSIDEKLY